MARKTRYHKIVTKEKMEEVLGENKELLDDFLEYCRAVNRSPATIYQYRNLLQIFFVWNLEDNENKSYFVITKRDFMTFFGYLTGVLGARHFLVILQAFSERVQTEWLRFVRR